MAIDVVEMYVGSLVVDVAIHVQCGKWCQRCVGKTWRTPINTGCKKKSLIDRVSCRHVHVLFLVFVNFFIIFNYKEAARLTLYMANIGAV